MKKQAQDLRPGDRIRLSTGTYLVAAAPRWRKDHRNPLGTSLVPVSGGNTIQLGADQPVEVESTKGTAR